MAKDVVAVIDGGGTQVRVAAVTEDGEILSRRSEVPYFGGGNEEFNRQLLRMKDDAFNKAVLNGKDFAGWISAFAGPYDRKTGYIHAHNCAPYPITFVRSLRIPMNLNDVGAASYGVYRFDSHAQSYLDRSAEEVGDTWVVDYQTISTGTNTVPTIIFEVDGKKHARIVDNVEAGHYPLIGSRRCNCGQTGCAETVISGTGLAKRVFDKFRDLQSGSNYETELEQTAKRRALAMHSSDADEVMAKVLPPIFYQFIRKNKELHFWTPVANRISSALADHMRNVVCMHHPGVYKFGGSMMKDADLLLAPAIEEFQEEMKIYGDDYNPVIGLANYKGEVDIENMPVRGAAAYFFDHFFERTKTTG